MGFRWDKYEAWRNHPLLTNQLRVAGEVTALYCLIALESVVMVPQP